MLKIRTLQTHTKLDVFWLQTNSELQLSLELQLNKRFNYLTISMLFRLLISKISKKKSFIKKFELID